ncbi:type I polyketide synthase [Kitasatospora sp. NPDC048194]|uniref:type I polyketide synthase n=1 Tax=Kitasatospora sp. NPDC048194 TaxID=3364045 RepID=UPI003718B708
MVADRAVAVIGMACRYPGASNVREFWANLRAGVEGITHFDVDELLAAGADPEYVRRPEFVGSKGVLAGSRNFDWRYFRYPRAEAAVIDPQQRVFLECAATAVDDAGMDPTRFPGRIGVYAGSDRTAQPDDDLSPLARVISLEKDFVATRVAYKLGLRGPAVTVQTACSTSLTAIHMAVQSLLGGECDAALAGGVAVSPKGEWGFLHEPGGVLSPDGHCRPFDAEAGGTVPSEGVGVVVLKRLADALRDGDRIAAVVRGSAINNDGAEKLGFTAPSIPGQAEVIRHAHRVAGVDADRIGYVECHGTATRLGDPVEVAALTEAFRLPAGEPTCWLGSVKSNIGHTSVAAGVAGFIKTVLMLEHGELVPTLNFRTANPLLDLDSSPFQVSTRTQRWEPERRTAGVSAFGVGGTNAHVVLEAAPRQHERAAADHGPRVLTLSATTPEALRRMRTRLAERLEADEELELPAVARTLADRRVHPLRQSVAVADRAAAAQALLTAAEPVRGDGLGKVAFLFPGHGVLRHAAGTAAYRLLPDFARAFDELRAAAAGLGLDLAPLVAGEDAPAAWFDEFVHHQVGLFTLGYALGHQLKEWGVKPAAMFGNSAGEYAAAAVAGVWAPEDALRLVHERAVALRATEPGRMLAVNASLEEVAERVPLDGRIAVSMVARGGVVLSGPAAEMTRLLDGDALHGLDLRVLNVDRAAHCDILMPVADRLTELVAGIPAELPGVRLVSNVSGGFADPAAVTTPEYWALQVRRPVLLDAGMATLLDSDCDTFLELGPGATMLGALRWSPDWDGTRAAVPVLGRAEDGELGLLRALGVLWERGLDVLEPPVSADGRRPAPVSLPGYPFAEEDPELEPEPAAEPAGAPEPDDPDALRPLLERLWCRTLGVASVRDEDGFFALGGESLTVLSLLSRLREQAGVSVPAAEFMREATFGRLLALAEEQRALTGPAPLVGAVTLREGTGRPVVLVADAAGSAWSYQELAQALETDRPVVVLEPMDGESGRGTIEEIAAHHVQALLAVQPEGPYTLGGWSFGSVVAHEMSTRLRARGAAVDLLVCLDSYLPGRPGQAFGATPDFLLGHARLVGGAFLGLGASGRAVRRNPALRRLLLDKFRLLSRYRPRPAACPVLVFKVDTDRAGAERLERRIRAMYTAGVRVRAVAGDHWSMLRPPLVGRLAGQLSEALVQAAAAVEPSPTEEEHHGDR